MLERFTLQQKLGEGSQGQVYAAYDAQLARQVAIKIALPSQDQRERAQSVERFRREQQVLGSLSNPGILSLLDHGTTTSGEPFYTSELLEGVTLEQAIERHGAAPVGVTAVFAARALNALASVHAARVVHQDLTPANFVICRDHRVVLIDFGLARATGDESAEQDVSGTPQFMAPEQLKGGKPQPASDVYSLGATLFFMLTGEKPFGDLIGLDLLLAVSRGKRASLVGRSLQPEIVSIIEWMLAHDAAARPTVEEARVLFRSLIAELPRAQILFPAWASLISARKQR